MVAYTKQTWIDNDPSTPLSADRLNHIEDGLGNASDSIEVLEEYGVWQSFSPSFGITIGDGTVSCQYTTIGNVVIAEYHLVFGASSVVSGTVNVDLPVSAAANGSTNIPMSVSGIAYDASASTMYSLFGYQATSTSVSIRAMNGSGTYVYNALITSTVPFTWAVGDKLSFIVIYRKA
jgi:hypothetical protein